jgi:fucose 4-O-acetylase-like acetyltransferase
MSKIIKHNSNLLSDVVVIRNILIVLLVFYHAFAIYSGAWKPIAGFPIVKAYWWFDKLSYAFMLELFVFISGFVFGYQVRQKGESKLQAKSLFWGKFKRLIVPSIFFSLLYMLIWVTSSNPYNIFYTNY